MQELWEKKGKGKSEAADYLAKAPRSDLCFLTSVRLLQYGAAGICMMHQWLLIVGNSLNLFMDFFLLLGIIRSTERIGGLQRTRYKRSW